MSRHIPRPLRALVLGTSAICLSAGLAAADQVILDDLIVDGSACLGFDCVNGESFGFDTLRLKENNLRIRAQDTSSSASFPTNDWQITFNETSNGGANKFSIDDIDGGRTPFTIEASAPSHSLYVDDGGRIGFGTSTPVVELHVKDGDTPTLRLEQDGSSGFTPQTFDVAANETNFFLRDATNGSTLPFRVRPGAPTSAIDVAASGNVGLGTSSPDADLHIVGGVLRLEATDSGAAGTPPDAAITVRQTDGTAAIRITEESATNEARDMLTLVNNGGARLRMENSSTGNRWVMAMGNAAPNDLLINYNGTDAELQLESNGNLTITGTLTTAGSCSTGCDRVFDAEYEILPIDQRAELMWTNGYLPNVGPTPEDGPFNISDKMGRMLNELEHAHIYIAQLNDRIARLEAQLAE